MNLEGKKVDDSVVDRCIENLKERKRQGMIRYGKFLGLSTIDKRSPLTEAREEAEDLVVYLTWEEHQREILTSFLSTLLTDVELLLSNHVEGQDADGDFACPFMKKLRLDLEQGKDIREVLRSETIGENCGRSKCCPSAAEGGDIGTQDETCESETGN